MKKVLIGVASLSAIAGFFLYKAYGGFAAPLEAPNGVPYVKPVPADWAAYQAERMMARDLHIQNLQPEYNRFADFAESETDGVPLVILKLLPKLAPEFWGEGDNFLSVMGLFFDERLPGAPVPRGMGLSGLAREKPLGNIDYASFSCGACHIGRVRIPESGENHPEHIYYLDGGINSEFNVVGYRKRLNQTIDKITAGEKNPQKKVDLFTQAVLAQLDQVHQSDPNYFYRNFKYEDKVFDAAYESAQIELFKKQAPSYVAEFIKHHVNEYDGWKSFVAKYYVGAEPLLLDGMPGTEDAIGFNTVKANYNFKQKWFTKPFAGLALPPSHGVTDIMAVWEQNLHDPEWNSEKTDLINGGGQWTGHIPLPMYKNIAAQLTIGYENIDVRVSAFAEKVLDKMPAAVYPFPVDVELAKKGQSLFAENCAACHQPHNGKVYNNIGTDDGRARIAGLFVTLGAISGFTDVCGADTEVNMLEKLEKPCATFKGVSLAGKQSLAMTPTKQHEGYNALPLVGLWAQAPYLHNGSVPTLYHLLVPGERPEIFVKSRLDFDTQKVGFVWEQNAGNSNEGYLLDTRLAPALSNKGHDRDIQQGEKLFKLDWANDKEGAMALIEYLKTL